MRVRFTSGARRQIEAALDYVAEASPGGALRIRDRITEVTELLRDHPLAGRATARRGIRRVALNPFPYLVFYRAARDEIVILRFRHGARREIHR